ncbi:HK97-gp10 family putative phage morphogenesis protein [Arthrobacter sp. 31Y]|uniref:HK97-gp10 family putative phage morphogenesis protein n=1 Tax=Arthrobacter sp. 31Y TaxID=1115632 RepID=UPI00046429C0|nr:HK97-gp10 family putative phage morphogenesis protein [Arthrobacter sp. 31Y]
MGTDASELRKLAADIGKGIRETGPRAQVVVRKTAIDGVRIAKNKVPVDTGNLKSTIGHSDLRTVGQSGTIGAEFGPTAEYGPYVELGTSRMAPQPFMGPAADEIAGPFEQAMAQLGAEVLRG